jgi:biotin carboxyl carrier protein
MELGDLPRLLALARAHAVAELEIVSPSGRLRFRRADQSFAPPAIPQPPVGPAPASIGPPVSIVPPGTPHAEAIRLAALYDDSRLHLVRASGVGRFVPPDEPDQVLEVGAQVNAGASLGSIKSLGVKRTVLAPVSGVIAAVYARPGDALQYGHLIVGIESGPAAQR